MDWMALLGSLPTILSHHLGAAVVEGGVGTRKLQQAAQPRVLAFHLGQTQVVNGQLGDKLLQFQIALAQSRQVAHVAGGFAHAVANAAQG